jgi:hypothetical protein
VDTEDFPLRDAFSSAKNLNFNRFTWNAAVTQHHLAIQASETKTASHQFFNMEEMRRSWE